MATGTNDTAEKKSLADRITEACDALAGIVAQLVEAIPPTRTHSGDEIVYDGVGRAELERLRALLSHPDRDALTTWEVVEIAADELGRARAGASS